MESKVSCCGLFKLISSLDKLSAKMVSQVNKTTPFALTERLWFNNSTGTNYQLWKNHVRHHFQAQDLLGFIDGTNLPPPKTVINAYNSKPVRMPEYSIWRRKDESLKQGILSLLEDEVISPADVDTMKTSRDIWLHLEEKFRKHLQEVHTADGSDEQDDAIIANAGQNQLLRDWDEYSELYSAALMGDRIAGTNIFTAVKANKINSKFALALPVAVGAGEKAIDFVKNIVCIMPNGLLSVKDAGGNTALNIAAAVGNRAAAIVLVAHNSNLLYVPNISGDFPVHVAAKHAKRDTLIYLISVTKDDHSDLNPYEGYYGLELLTYTIEAGFCDIALYLVKKYPYLARLRLSANSALKSIAEQNYRPTQKPNDKAQSKTPLVNISEIGSNIEGLYIPPPVVRRFLGSGDVEHSIKSTQSKKQLLVMEIVKLLLKEMRLVSFIEVEELCRDAILVAAKSGNHEIVREILEAFPSTIHCPSFLQSIIRVAVENRYNKVFNIVYQMSDYTHINMGLPDINGNNLLHLVAKLAPLHTLNALPNAAIRFHYEIQWYEEVENLIPHRCREQINNENKSPSMIFRETHLTLRAEAEKWVKDAVNSCTISAALISTISFAAAITVLGGNNSSGFPLLHKEPAFVLFAVSDAISLVSSLVALLTFLFVSVSRYVEEDFTLAIPMSFAFGLGYFIISIFFLLSTITATIHLVFGQTSKTVLVLAVWSVMALAIFFYILFMPLLKIFKDIVCGKTGGFLGKRRVLSSPPANMKVAKRETVLIDVYDRKRIHHLATGKIIV